MTERRRWPILEPAPSWRDRTPADHARGIELACEAALQLLAERPDRAARLDHADPVPASTRALLRRLAVQG
jgi:hypothetical protein